MLRLFPSLIAANPLTIGKVIKKIEPWCDGFHIDIMDNHFVPNLYGSAELINRIAQQTEKTLWIHLMIDQPHTFVTRLSLPIESIISIHIESTNALQTYKEIKQRGWLTSIAINPLTPIKALDSIVEECDHILIMSVQPGFSGQPFVLESVSKINQLQQLMKIKNLKKTIGIDGGITKEKLIELSQLGVSDFVIGHSIFGKKNYVQACQEIKQLLTDLQT